METSDLGYWCCPIDFRVTLLCDRTDSLSRTVRWIVTPGGNAAWLAQQCSGGTVPLQHVCQPSLEEVFFPVLPLADVERFVSSSGALKVRAEVMFHLRLSKDPH